MSVARRNHISVFIFLYHYFSVETVFWKNSLGKIFIFFSGELSREKYFASFQISKIFEVGAMGKYFDYFIQVPVMIRHQK